MTYKIYDLSNHIPHMCPSWPHLGMFREHVLRRVQHHTLGLPGGITRQVSVWEGQVHSGTHCDSPGHEKRGGWLTAEIPLDRCYGTGVVVDMRYMKKWDKIDAEALEKATPKIEEGDFVVLNTGWHRYWRVKEYVYHNHYPGIVPSGAWWLVKKKVIAVAAPWGSLDHPMAYADMKDDYKWRYDEYKKETGRDALEDFPDYEPCHNIICMNDILGIEMAGGQMDEVTGKRCTLAAFPCKLEGSRGIPLRLVAIVEE
ncbi:cyclase family protein [Chloroflexota bacterium]